MTTAQAIVQHIESLPEAAQIQVLNFVEFLESKTKAGTLRESDMEWHTFSLDSAMRGMETEPSPYTTADLKESFQ